MKDPEKLRRLGHTPEGPGSAASWPVQTPGRMAEGSTVVTEPPRKVRNERGEILREHLPAIRAEMQPVKLLIRRVQAKVSELELALSDGNQVFRCGAAEETPVQSVQARAASRSARLPLVSVLAEDPPRDDGGSETDEQRVTEDPMNRVRTPHKKRTSSGSASFPSCVT